MCSANVVASGNGDTIATARHCGFGDGGINYRFAPGYDRGYAPHGWWTWRRAGWTTIPGAPGDTAFLVLNTQNGRHVQNVVGSSGLIFNSRPGYMHLFGIPGDKNYKFECQGYAGYMFNDAVVTMGNCNGMSGGASGGAFLLRSYQIATYLGTCNGMACGPLFGNVAFAVYEGARNA